MNQKDFKELLPPQQGYEQKWYIVAVGYKHWLSIDGDVIPDTVGLPSLYFDTKLEALETACTYYEKHGQVHPHAQATITINNVGSQVMEFI